jgi:acetyl-CoA carboxylase biotin carboxyl carrier protein
MDLKKIKQVIGLMTENDLSEFSYEECDKYKIRIKKGFDAPVITMAPGSAGSATSNSSGEPAQVDNDYVVESPLVGTFYTAPTPSAPAYAQVGDTVSEDTVICIVEAMKVMNEITAGVKGTITEILVNNADPVEYGQALLKIKI